MNTNVIVDSVIVIALFVGGGLCLWQAIFNPGWFVAPGRPRGRYSTGMAGRVIYILEGIFCILLGIVFLVEILLK